ncbi:MAG: chromate transporter [Acetanaerobacterium sp.]
MDLIMPIALQLFLSFMQIGLFSIGGGYAILPLIKEQVVDAHGWLTLNQFADVVAISQMTPGPIALNAATFVGIRLAGVSGAILATVGCILPSCIIVLVIARFYIKYRSFAVAQGVLDGLRPTVVALIATASLSILLFALFGSDELPLSLAHFSLSSALIFAAGLIILRTVKPSAVLIILGAGGISLLISLIPQTAHP